MLPPPPRPLATHPEPVVGVLPASACNVAAATAFTPQAVKPLQPLTPVSMLPTTPASAKTGLSSAWADLEAFMLKPSKPTPSVGLRTPSAPCAAFMPTPQAAPPAASPHAAAAPVSPSGAVDPTASSQPAQPAPLFNPITGTPVAPLPIVGSSSSRKVGPACSKLGAKKNCASKVDLSAQTFDDFGSEPLQKTTRQQDEDWGSRLRSMRVLLQ